MYLAVCMRLPTMSKQLDSIEIIIRDSSGRAGNSQQQLPQQQQPQHKLASPDATIMDSISDNVTLHALEAI